MQDNPHETDTDDSPAGENVLVPHANTPLSSEPRNQADVPPAGEKTGPRPKPIRHGRATGSQGKHLPISSLIVTNSVDSADTAGATMHNSNSNVDKDTSKGTSAGNKAGGRWIPRGSVKDSQNQHTQAHPQPAKMTDKNPTAQSPRRSRRQLNLEADAPKTAHSKRKRSTDDVSAGHNNMKKKLRSATKSNNSKTHKK